MNDNPLKFLKPPCKSSNPIMNQANYIKNNISKAIMENKNHVSILLKNEELNRHNKFLLEDNDFLVKDGWIGFNVIIEDIVYLKVYQYDIFW